MDNEKDHWLLVGYPEAGKSTFASQMSPEYLVIDTDVRASEQERNFLGKYHIVNGADALEIVNKMDALLPKLRGRVGTVIIDSGTVLLDLAQAYGRLKVEQKEARPDEINKNKADTMRALRWGIQKYYCNSIWIFHIERHALKGEWSERKTITSLEQDRLRSSLNAMITIQRAENGKRAARIDWSRFNDSVAAGKVVADYDGMWKNAPQRISQFIRYYTPDCEYNGAVSFSLEWLFAFLGSKEKFFTDIDDMRTKLDIVEVPMWFERRKWLGYLKKAGVE